jgi:adenylate cyclase
MDTLGCPPDKAEEIAACHAAFLARYRARDWSEASARLEKCRDQGVKSLETLYNLFESRIEAFRENPPPADWDGTFVAEEK